MMTTDVGPAPRGTKFDDDLYEKIVGSIAEGDELRTLGRGRPNKIFSIDRTGIRVTTLQSEGRGARPQLVPAWMIVRAWDHLSSAGVLTQEGLKYQLGVHRSVFVCALLATFAEVEVESRFPAKLRLR
jgi:hypothetical protein